MYIIGAIIIVAMICATAIMYKIIDRDTPYISYRKWDKLEKDIEDIKQMIKEQK